jgi:OCT family organic cation transporter-like MFS transporter 4/5
MVGMLVGSFAFGYISDKIGRRHTLHLSSIVVALGGTISATLPARASMFSAYAAMRFVSGVGHVGMFMMAFGLSLEYTGPRWRVFCGCLIETPFAIGKKRKEIRLLTVLLNLFMF